MTNEGGRSLVRESLLAPFPAGILSCTSGTNADHTHGEARYVICKLAMFPNAALTLGMGKDSHQRGMRERILARAFFRHWVFRHSSFQLISP